MENIILCSKMLNAFLLRLGKRQGFCSYYFYSTLYWFLAELHKRTRRNKNDNTGKGRSKPLLDMSLLDRTVYGEYPEDQQKKF